MLIGACVGAVVARAPSLGLDIFLGRDLSFFDAFDSLGAIAGALVGCFGKFTRDLKFA
jgi:hypothetical protein